MSLRFRILLLTGLFFALLMGIGWVGLDSTNDLHKELLARHRQTSQAELNATAAQATFEKQVQEWMNVLVRGDSRQDQERYWARFLQQEAATRRWVEVLMAGLPPESEAVTLADNFLSEHRQLGETHREALARMQAGGGSSLRNADEMVRRLDRELAETFDHIVHILSADRKSMEASMGVLMVRNTALTAISMGGAAMVSFLVLACWLHRWVNRPVRSVINQAEKIAEGNFDQCEELSSSSEIVQLQQALNAMAGSLKSSYEGLETANRELERARDEALDASRLKSEFLANVSHEMRTPLNGIIGMSELLTETPLNRDQTIMADIARVSAKTLLAVINDLLDFSKIEADSIDLHCIEFSLEGLLEEAIMVVTPRVDANDVALGSVVERGVPQQIWGDPVRLKQILTNLLANAGKFTQRGEISLRTRVLEVVDRRVHLEFVVSDTGIGIPEDKLEVIFEAFRQADGTSAREHSGTGLGLSISQRLATLMGGNISVESEVGKGSCFTVEAWFPIGQGQVEYSAPDRLIRGKRVLIVDDHAINREILVRQTESWGCHTHAVALASEALDVLNSLNGGNGVDLIITDYQMPGMDGHEFARRVMDRADCKDLPIILLTSVAPGQGMVDTPGELFAGVATKPVIKRSLYEVVAGVLGGAASPVQPPVPEKALKPPKAPSSARVLLVEDDKMNRKYLSMLLRKSGFEHDMVENGKEAVAAVQKGIYDLVLMDCSMPVMDGYEATRRIRETAVIGRGPHIIGLTGHAGTEARDKCMAAGMDQYISKPVEPEQLLQEIDNLVAVPSR